MARDDFPQSIISRLRERVNLRCSNPSCRVPTSAPSNKSNDAVNNTGIAAHICAASEGGPRYRDEMTTKERRSIENAIWLCANCSIKIDRDEESYSEEILKEWKNQAEETAKVEQGNKLPRKEDAIDTLTTALTGFPKRFIADAITNIHRASEKSLEALDPRFEIKSAHSENRTCFQIRAKENVPLEMNINKHYAQEFSIKFNELIEHGEELKIDSCAISFEKSHLLEELFSSITDGNLHFHPSQKIQAVHKLWVRKQSSDIVETFDDVCGEIYFGTKSFTFKGTACNGLFELTFKKPMELSNNIGNITLSLITKKWERMDIRCLPYFDKVLSLFSKLADGWELNIALEIEGKQMIVSKGMMIKELDNIIGFYDFLKYIDLCKVVSEFTDVKLQFLSEACCSGEDYRNLIDIVDILQGKKIYSKKNSLSNITTNLIVNEDAQNIEIIMSTKEPISIKYIIPEEQINIFETTITLPSKVISMKSVLPKIDKDIVYFKEGDVVTIEWIPCDDFSFEISYEKNGNGLNL